MQNTINCGTFNINKLEYLVSNENQETEYDSLEVDLDITIWCYDVFVNISWDVNSACLIKDKNKVDISEFVFVIQGTNNVDINQSTLFLRSAYIDYVEKTVTIDY